MSDKVQELMKLGYYDNKMRLVYYHIDNPPTCSICDKVVDDEAFISSRSGKVWCIDHAPFERQVHPRDPKKVIVQARLEAYR